MLEPLKYICKIDPSSDLFSKIESRVKEGFQSKASIKELMVAGVVLVVLLTSNALLVGKAKSNQSATDMNESFNINISNQLYNE